MAKARKQKVNLESVSQAHGALPAAQSVQEIMGYTTGYTEASVDEYLAKIDAMTDIDLGEHAIEMDIVPSNPRSLLRDKLENRFRTAQNKFLYRQNPSRLSAEDEAKLKKLLRAGA